MMRAGGQGVAQPALARPEHWPAVRNLLQSHHLPLDGAQQHFENFLVLFDGQDLIGTAGLEIYGEVGLIRSVAVDPSRTKGGLGTRLTLGLLNRARKMQLDSVYLLTTTAAEFFAKRGFQRIERSTLPPVLSASRELQGACPASAIAMRLTLARVS